MIVDTIFWISYAVGFGGVFVHALKRVWVDRYCPTWGEIAWGVLAATVPFVNFVVAFFLFSSADFWAKRAWSRK